MSKYSYVLEKLEQVDLNFTPFKHLYIENLFTPEDFEEVIRSPQIEIPPVKSDAELIETLYSRSYKEIVFPGTTTDIPAYLKWHADPKNTKNLNIDICEGFGVTMRLLESPAGSVIQELHRFFKSDEFWNIVSKRFGVDQSLVTRDAGLQKYLDGYEISPHPDIRRKALTFMLNLNPAENSESLEYHTHYMHFVPQRDYIREFWNTHPQHDRCWVPWDWCATTKKQTLNNSLVVFSPDNDTLHAVRASYDHLRTQRTQFYGNLWYKEARAKYPSWWAQYKDPAKLPAN